MGEERFTGLDSSVREVMGTPSPENYKPSARALSTMLTATTWLKGTDTSAFQMYNTYCQETVKAQKPWERLLFGKPVIDSDRLGLLIAGAAYTSRMTDVTPATAMQSIVSKYKTGRKDFTHDSSADIAVIAETHGKSLAEVVTLIRKLRANAKLVQNELVSGSGLVTLASAILAEGGDKENLIVDTYVDLAARTKGKVDTDDGLNALLQACLLNDKEYVLKRFNSLCAEIIVASGEKEHPDKIPNGSKAFLVLAEILGKWEPDDFIPVLQSIMSANNLDQAAATRFILAHANNSSETPVLCRQGEEEERSSFPATGGTQIHHIEYNYHTAALRLGRKKSS